MFTTSFCPVDAQDEEVRAPFQDKDLCFRKAHLPNIKAMPEEIAQAKAATRQQVIIED